jgi:cytochrome c oxidase cbb3-type subunit 3
MKLKLRLTVLILLVFTFITRAQPADAGTAVAATPPEIPSYFFDPLFYFLATLFLIMFIAIVVLTRAMMKMLNPQTEVKENLVPEEIIADKKEPESVWKKFDRKFLTRATPIEKEKDIMFEHGYDGIRELDNDLPPWWKYGFYLTILFAVIYLLHYHVLDTGKLSIQEYNEEITVAEAELKERMLKNADMVSAQTVAMLNEPDALNKGQGIYSQNCVACHGQNGEGGVGPNLTDEFWIHGGGIKNVFTVVQDGVPAKGMISWKSQLSPKQIQQVASYILTMQGTKPANAKDPQGEVWKDENAADSVKISMTDTSHVNAVISQR